MPILGTIASSRKTGVSYTSGFYTISSGNPSGSSASFSITSIPSTYQHLQLRAIVRGDYGPWNGAGFSMTINNDSTSNIYYTSREGVSNNGGGPVYASNGASNRIGISYLPVGGAAANLYGAYIIDFYNYTSTSVTKSFNSFGIGLLEDFQVMSGNYNSTSAITSLEFTTNDGTTDRGNILSNSVFSLYGWKDA